MELWIRSQDKKHLAKCEAIMYEETGTGYGLRVFTKNYDFNMARYETKERALEVLDEIQKLLMPVITYTQKEPIKSDLGQGIYQIKQDVDLKIQQLSIYVYEMPIE